MQRVTGRVDFYSQSRSRNGICFGCCCCSRFVRRAFTLHSRKNPHSFHSSVYGPFGTSGSPSDLRIRSPCHSGIITNKICIWIGWLCAGAGCVYRLWVVLLWTFNENFKSHLRLFARIEIVNAVAAAVASYKQCRHHSDRFRNAHCFCHSPICKSHTRSSMPSFYLTLSLVLWLLAWRDHKTDCILPFCLPCCLNNICSARRASCVGPMCGFQCMRTVTVCVWFDGIVICAEICMHKVWSAFKPQVRCIFFYVTFGCSWILLMYALSYMILGFITVRRHVGRDCGERDRESDFDEWRCDIVVWLPRGVIKECFAIIAPSTDTKPTTRI